MQIRTKVKNSILLPIEIQLFPSPQRFLLHPFLVTLQLVRALHFALLFRCNKVDFIDFSPPPRYSFSFYSKELRTLPILHFRLVGLRLDVLRLRDPVQITSQIVLDLLFLPQFVKVAPRLRLLPLL